jgi:hypothetical protein
MATRPAAQVLRPGRQRQRDIEQRVQVPPRRFGREPAVAFDQRLQQRRLIETLAADLVEFGVVPIGDDEERNSIQMRIGDSVHHVGEAQPRVVMTTPGVSGSSAVVAVMIAAVVSLRVRIKVDPNFGCRRDKIETAVLTRNTEEPAHCCTGRVTPRRSVAPRFPARSASDSDRYPIRASVPSAGPPFGAGALGVGLYFSCTR